MTEAKLGYRAKNLIEIAKALMQGVPSMDELYAMDPQAAKQKLLGLCGIGGYSAELVMPQMGSRLIVGAQKYSASYSMRKYLKTRGKRYLNSKE